MTHLITCVLILLAMAPAVSAQSRPAGLDADQIGSESVSFATSCAPAVRVEFNKAVALLHSFWFPEAIKAFEGVAAADPGCAMAHWGIALSQWGNPFAGLKMPPVIQRGAATVEKARTTGNPTARERGYIEAVAHLYSSQD